MTFKLKSKVKYFLNKKFLKILDFAVIIRLCIMNKILKNDIISNLHEYDNDEDIDNLFFQIFPPYQKSSYLKIFLQNPETEKRSIYSKKLFISLLSLGKTFQNKIRILNYTKYLTEFLTDIKDSEYLKNNFHFVSRCIQRILQYFYFRKEFGPFCLISYKAKLLELEDVPTLPLFFNQNQDIYEVLKENFTFINPIISNSDEKLLIWCYFENMHNDFCKIIDSRKNFILDDFTQSIIKQRIQVSEKLFHHYPKHFIDFLLKIYPTITQNLIKPNLQKNPCLIYLQNNGSKLIPCNNSESTNFDDNELPYPSIRHYFNVSVFQLQNKGLDNSPQSLPAKRKKLITLQERSKIEFKLNLSIAQRFQNSHIHFQGKNITANQAIPSNFIYSDFKLVVDSLSKHLKNNEEEIIVFNNNNNCLSYHEINSKLNRAKSRQTISLHLIQTEKENIQTPALTDIKKNQNGQNFINISNFPKTKLQNDLVDNANPPLERSDGYQFISNKKNNDFKEERKIKLTTLDLKSNEKNSSTNANSFISNKENKSNEGHYYSRANNCNKIEIQPPSNSGCNYPPSFKISSNGTSQSQITSKGQQRRQQQQNQVQNSSPIFIQKRNNNNTGAITIQKKIIDDKK